MSKEKTRNFFSNNVHHFRVSEITQAFDFTLTGDMGKYLWMPLQHTKMTSRSFNHITTKFMQHLSSWKANSLSLTGRVTLYSSVLMATPLYSMQTVCLSQPVCDHIDGVCRVFHGDILKAKGRCIGVIRRVCVIPKELEILV